jgi:peptidase M16-like protein
VQITAAMPLGRALERADEAGAAEVLSRALQQQINEGLGSGFVGRVQVEQDVDLTRISVQTMADGWRGALSAVVNAVRQPAIETRASETQRTGAGFVRQTRGLGGAGFRPAVELARLLSSYPLAPPDQGLAVSSDAVRTLASRSLGPDAVVIGIGGGVSRENVQRELNALTSAWSGAAAREGAAPASTPAKPTATRTNLIDELGYTTWIAVGHPMPRLTRADEAAVAVMAGVLNIRLNIAVREIRGLANQCVLQVPATPTHEGLLQVRTGARPESVAPLIRYSLEELSRIRDASGAPTTDELEEVKGGLVLGAWQGSLDGSGNVSATYALEDARYGSLERLMRWPDAVRAVTARDVTDAAARYIQPDRMGVVIIGQLDAVRKARHPRWPATLEEVLPGRTR